MWSGAKHDPWGLDDEPWPKKSEGVGAWEREAYRAARWSADVPFGDEDIADELLSWGYSIEDIETGFRDDPQMMRGMVEDYANYELETEEV